jgi:heavy metal sensor kinase
VLQWWLAETGKIARGLRFRLTMSYVVILALLLVGIGLYFRVSLERLIEARTRELIEEEWRAVRGFVRIERGQATWTFDPREVEDASYVERLRRLLLIADREGTVLEVSNGYRAFGVETPAEIAQILTNRMPQWKLKRDGRGTTLLLRYGIIRAANQPYVLVVGRTLTDNETLPARFVSDYFSVLPVLLGLTLVLGWFIAGRGLEPVNRVAATAQEVSSSTLHVRIPGRGTDDELDRLIDAFNKMMDRLSQGFEQVRRFSTDVSHELRTPLTSIRGQLEVALFTAKTKEQYREAIVNALQDVDRLSSIVRALLLLSQSEAGHLVLKFLRLNLSETVTEIVEQFQIPAEDAGVRLDAELPAEVWVDADRVQMERLVANLLSNAVKYTPAGGRIQVTLRAMASEQGDAVEMCFSDTGQGIPAESLPHIFERFYKVPGGDPEKGLGLGLSFVAWIVRAHHGRIEVESKVGEGTRFRVLLPASPEPGVTLAGLGAGLGREDRRG